MSLIKQYLLVLLATLACLSQHEVEARDFRPRPEFNVGDLQSLLNNPASTTSILELILQSRGTSVEKIHDSIAGADGNLESIVALLNSEVKGDLARIDRDSIRLNPEEIKNLLRDGVQATIRNQFSNNPLAASILEENVKQQFSIPSEKFNALIESSAIPLESASKFLETHHINRHRRSLQPRDFDLGQVVSDLVFSLVRDQLSSVIWTVLETLKNTLISLRTNTAPNDTVNNVLSYAINSIVNGGIQLITEIQENIRPSNVTTDNSVSRRKRQAGDDTDATPDDDSTNTDTDGDDNNGGGGGGGGGGGLSIILQPILGLVSLLLSPVRLVLNLLLNGLLTLLRPLLGDALSDSLSSVVNSVIDLLIPSL